MSRPALARIPGTGVPDALMAVALLVFAEIMFFAALISAYLVTRSYASSWPPLGQPRLPLEVTGANTAVLSASGILLWRSFSGPEPRKTHLWALGLGILFLAIQGGEWVRMVGFGLTLTSGSYGNFFYLLIGAHGVHALAGIAALALLPPPSPPAGSDGRGRAHSWNTVPRKAAALYWYFVVALWPVLYVMVYLV